MTSLTDMLAATKQHANTIFVMESIASLIAGSLSGNALEEINMFAFVAWNGIRASSRPSVQEIRTKPRPTCAMDVGKWVRCSKDLHTAMANMCHRCWQMAGQNP